jgi:uncharacterized membrane protein YeaQ/YmgE (transglycosylase-associated protein family)
MTLLGLFVLLVIGAVCGALAQLVVGYDAGGFLTSAGLGIVGSVIGTWVAGALRLPSLLVVRIDGMAIEVIWAVVGAAILLAIIALIRGRNRRLRDSFG